jgi:hypothetical protein
MSTFIWRLLKPSGMPKNELAGRIFSMKTFSKTEVETIISQGKALIEHEINYIINILQKEHPGVHRVIYGEPPDTIAFINKDMADLYLELSFDVVWLFYKAFGKPPTVQDNEAWVKKKLSLLDAELKSLSKEFQMNGKFRNALQERFVAKSLNSEIQLALLQYLENEVRKYVSFNKERSEASLLTTNLLFVLVRLFGDLYALKPTKMT